MLFKLKLFSEKEMETFGHRLSQVLIPPMFMALEGALGAGKTTLVRAILRGLGYSGRVKSPTYTLVESYDLPHVHIFHLDLYRIEDPQALEFLGIEEIFQANALWLVEWPSKGKGFLPIPDFICRIDLKAGTERHLQLESLSEKGERIMETLSI